MLTTSAILTCETGSGRGFGCRAVERRRAARLPDYAVCPSRVSRPQNRADIVRILDAVEHDDQRYIAGAANQIAHIVAIDRHDFRGDPLMNAASVQSIEFAGRHTAYGNPVAVGRLHRFDDAATRRVR
jgi:hypothetical protein